MIRNRKKKNVFLTYDKTQLQAALDAVQTCRVGIRKATRAYNIPRLTLSDRVTCRVLIGSMFGRPSALPSQLEEELEAKTQQAAAMGFGIRQK